jgi:membrane protein
LLALAASVAFYSVLALSPAIGACISCCASLADAALVSKLPSILADIMPSGALELLGAEVSRIAKSGGKLTVGFVLGLGVALWRANAGMKAIFDVLSIICDEEEKRGFVRLNLVSLAFTACAIAGAAMAIALVVVFPLLSLALGATSLVNPQIGFMRWPVLFVLKLAVLYRYGPSRRQPKWCWISVRSVTAALIWLAVSSLFFWCLGNFANYSATYGALGALVGLVMWMWVSTIVVLASAELNSEIEHQTAQDSTVGPPKPLGRRGAVVADRVGAAVR